MLARIHNLYKEERMREYHNDTLKVKRIIIFHSTLDNSTILD